MPDMTSVQLCDTQNAVPLTRKKLLADYCWWEASIFFPITYLGTLKFGFLLNAALPHLTRWRELKLPMLFIPNCSYQLSGPPLSVLRLKLLHHYVMLSQSIELKRMMESF